MINRRFIMIGAAAAVLLEATVCAASPEEVAAESPLPPKPRIAVLDFESPGLGNLGWQAAEMLRSAIVLTGRFDVVERARLNDLLQQRALAETGVVASGALAELGAYADAQAVVVGSVSSLADNYYINARVVDVATGIALSAKRLKSPDLEGLVDQIDLLAYMIAGEAYDLRPPSAEIGYKARGLPSAPPPIGSSSPELNRIGVAIIGFDSGTGALLDGDLERAVRDRFEESACCSVVAADELSAGMVTAAPDWRDLETLVLSAREAGAAFVVGMASSVEEDGFAVAVTLIEVDTGEIFSPIEITGLADMLPAGTESVADRAHRFLISFIGQ